MSASAEILASLNEDMALEHGAIMQYVIHGVYLRDVGITDQVRKIAREEMWHFEWLAEAVRDRGGEGVLDRADMFLSTSTADSLRADVGTEDLALSHYAHTLEVVGHSDPELSHLVERIVVDERHHRLTFERLAQDAQAAGEEAYAAHPITGPEDLAVIGPTIQTEYANVLQYLWNKYGCGDCEQAETYFELAVDDMRHLSQVASYVPGLGGPQPPDVPSDKVRAVHSTAEALEAASLLEDIAASFYSGKGAAAKGKALSDDLVRAADHHGYHRYQRGLTR
jgi:bacterioferritin